MDIRDFIGGLGPQSAAETVLYVAYYVEVVEECGSFTTSDIRRGFRDARVKALANPSDALGRFKREGKVIEIEPHRYVLSDAVLRLVSGKLNELGWFTSEPAESTDFIREVSEKLRADVLAIVDLDERSFLEEAMACLHPTVNAYRAAVIMGWAACVGNLRRKLLARGIAVVDAEVKRHFPRKKVEKATDLDDLKDSDLLTVCQGVGLLHKNVRTQLGHQLDLRNGCAHPTGVKPQLHVVRAFFEEIIQYVLAVP